MSPQDRDAIKAWVDGNADRDQARKVYEGLASLPVGEGWIWARDHDLLKHVEFPLIHTLDTSKISWRQWLCRRQAQRLGWGAVSGGMGSWRRSSGVVQLQPQINFDLPSRSF